MIGSHKNELPTPSLVVDLDIMEANLKKMADFLSGRKCKLRPHFKNHKCIALAKLQMKYGAIGMTTANLKETEALVNAGFHSILIANEITGEANLKRLVSLAKDCEIIVAVDSVSLVEQLAELVKKDQSKLGLVIDMDLGMKRCGVSTKEEALMLVQTIIASGLNFKGIMGYEGHLQRFTPTEESIKLRKTAMKKLVDIKKLLEANGISVSIVSTGGTGTYEIAGNYEGITEVQAGNYLLMDTSYAPFAEAFLPSLALLTSVISVEKGKRFVINAGVKQISSERGMPTLKNISGAILRELHAEHGLVGITYKKLDISVGDLVELDVYYSDATVNLHRELFGIRKNKVEQIFKIG